ncbi:hypothetical protein fugu_008242 [Takifugu bimaculatus]|uniref:Pannexin n=1 Tax=Takifugu bimaculatus TaxID=433685 RepID=A0A4Z2B0Y0_9TELE|nr:hypothetical protein fugu_008242 [Takifugu bimaculatus]
MPLFLISLAFAQEVSVGTQISCFTPTNFSRKQASYVDSFCWAAVQQQPQSAPLWLHKFFPYILLLLAILVYIPALFWRFTATPHLSSDLNFIMEELDRFYTRAIKMAKEFSVHRRQREPKGNTEYDGCDGRLLKIPFSGALSKDKVFVSLPRGEVPGLPMFDPPDPHAGMRLPRLLHLSGLSRR